MIESYTTINESCDIAHQYGTFELRGATLDGSESADARDIVRQFVCRSVWRKRKDGEWQFETYTTLEGLDHAGDQAPFDSTTLQGQE